MEDADFELLEKIEQGGRIFRPRDSSDIGRAAFQHTVDRLLSLRAVGLIRLLDGRILRAANGSSLLAGPCDLTLTGVAALADGRRLGLRAPGADTRRARHCPRSNRAQTADTTVRLW
jgi:hypothetical protein